MLESVKQFVGRADEADDQAATLRACLRLWQDDEAKRAAEDLLRALENREGELETRRTRAVSGMGAAADRRGELDRRAQALLNSGEVVESAEASLDRLRLDLSATHDEIRVVRKAIVLQREAVNRERGRLVSVIQSRLLPHRRAFAARVHAALRELTVTLAEEERFRTALRDAGIPTYVLTEQLPFEPVRLDSDYSAGSIWVREARAAGLLDADREPRLRQLERKTGLR